MIEVNFPKPIILPATGIEKDSVYIPDKNITEAFMNRYCLHGGAFDVTNVTVIDKDENIIRN